MPKCGSPMCYGRISRSRISKRRWPVSPEGSVAMAAGNIVRGSAGGSDLPLRLASAAVMLVLAVAAICFGGAVLDAFIAAVALAGFVEFARLVLLATPSLPLR